MHWGDTALTQVHSIRWLLSVLNSNSSQVSRVRYAIRCCPEYSFSHLSFCRGCPVGDIDLIDSRV